MEKIIDLHIHTNCSDGILSPKEVIDEAVKNKASVISIADHDTMDAYTIELENYVKEKKIKIIPAVEISTKTKKAGIHILGYNLDKNHKKLKETLSILKNARHTYLTNVSIKLEQLGYTVNQDALDKIDTVTKAHIAKDIIENPKNEKILLKEFGKIPSMGEFIETIMNEGCKAYVKKESISPKEASELIKDAGGKVVLAHPVAYQYEDNLNEQDILDLIKEIKADGIEANYIYIDRNLNKINEVEKWNQFAKKNHLIPTIGSDFHNKDGIHPEIGLISEGIHLKQESIQTLIQYLTNS